MKIHEAIKSTVTKLQSNGDTVSSKKWQAVDPPSPLWEIINTFIKMDMPESIGELEKLTLADLPWAENHFQERIAGIPANPGYEYQNWPYYKPSNHDSSFRAEGEGYFSHTYMERFWPDRNIKGTGKMAYTYGDFKDLIDRLKDDPGTRQAFFSIWHPEDQANHGVRVPCTLGYHFMIRKGKLEVTYLIRSCDALRHFKNDIYLTVRLAQYVRDQVNPLLKMGELSMWIGSFHCFEAERFILGNWLMEYINL